MKKIIITSLLPFLSTLLLAYVAGPINKDSTVTFPMVNYIFKSDRNNNPSVDHAKFSILNQTFDSAQQVTAACLSCHTERDKEIMSTSHWLWQREEEIEWKGRVPLGKRNILNNFCIGTMGSEATCTRCHIGYGWKDKNFNFDEPTNIDCLVCHDNTGTYIKGKGIAGLPDPSVNLNYVSKNVGPPTRGNCGVCHFWGGGGNNVKHGDLDVAMLDCSPEIDVHMTTEGEDMSCIDCHITDKHQMSGKVYALSSENKDRASCQYCHTNKPHKDDILNDHDARVACQTCHIPVYAKANATKMIWDWSTAGRLDKHGNTIHESDADGNHNYLSIKGNFVYDDHVIPEYMWFNGIANHQLIDDKIDTIPLQMNTLYGSYDDKGANMKSTSPSKIWPVKVHRGKQIYDTINMTLIQPKLWDTKKGEGAYWLDFDWDKASRVGMEYVGLPYSGAYGFIETEMYWPLNHQVSPANKSLKCIDCHTRPRGRLANLNDFYLPGRDFNPIVETAGISFILASLIGVGFHLLCRIVFRDKCKISEDQK
ncbi:MAG: tetrathionate reductase family octaheme c-type cytochrome [Bacteroidetes bacterium]|nr:tetrathionate reductase family octaheme c-type cytochrome [Bacteroidota bacterium]